MPILSIRLPEEADLEAGYTDSIGDKLTTEW